MEILLILVVIQGLMGAFDLVYHHEFLERLPWRRTAATELKLHGVRNFFYAVVFLSFGWVAWGGALAWIFGAILLIELIITLWDFVEEDLSRKLPATERVSHTLLALNYGAILAVFAPFWLDWLGRPTGFSFHEQGWLSWVMAVYAVGVFLWGFRDLLSGLALARRKDNGTRPAPLGLAKANQRILVAGGTGFVGRRLCQHLIDEGHRVTVITRDAAKAAALWHGRFTLVEDAALLTEEDAFDAVIDLVGEPIAQRWTKRARAEILASRVRMVRDLTAYIVRAREKPAVFVNASAIGIYGTGTDRVFDETSAPAPRPETFPEEVCLAREAATKPLEGMGIRVVQLRTGLVLERDGGVLGQMLFPFDWGLGGPIGHGRQWMSWIHRDDLVGLICLAVNSPGLAGPLNGTAPIPLRQRDFARSLGRSLRRPALLPLPGFVVRLLFGEMGRVLLLDGQRVMPAKAQASGYAFLYPEVDGALMAAVGER